VAELIVVERTFALYSTPSSKMLLANNLLKVELLTVSPFQIQLKVYLTQMVSTMVILLVLVQTTFNLHTLELPTQ
jgi:hypothetical protein